MTIGAIIAVAGFIIPQFLFIWTGGNSVTLFIAAGYFTVFAYQEVDLGWFGSSNDFGIHIFSPNWYLKPDDIGSGSELVDLVMNVFEVALYPGDFGNTSLAPSGMLFGLSLILAIVGTLFAIIIKNHKMAGIIFIITAVVSFLSLILTWLNSTDLAWFGGVLEGNFLPVPIGALVFLLAGLLEYRVG